MRPWIFEWKNITYRKFISHDDLNLHTIDCQGSIRCLPCDYVHKLNSLVWYSSFLPSASFSLDALLMCRVKCPERTEFRWLRAGASLGNRGLPHIVTCFHLRRQPRSSERVRMSWDPVRAMEQFLLPNFLAERRGETDSEHFTLGSCTHVLGVCVSDCMEGLCIFVLLQFSESFRNVKALFNLLGHSE